MPKAPRYKTPTGIQIRNNGSGNMPETAFRKLREVDSFTVGDPGVELKFETGDYALIQGTNNLREKRPQDYSYWVGKIIQIRHPNRKVDLPGAWLEVQWLWSGSDIREANPKIDVSGFGRWERSFSNMRSHIHSATIQGIADVRVLDESVGHIPDSGVFYVRSTFNHRTLALHHTVPKHPMTECVCRVCEKHYNPDKDVPMRYCAVCKTWCHSGPCATGSKVSQLVVSDAFTNELHYTAGRALAAPGERSMPGPRSAKSQKVAKRASGINFSSFLNGVPPDLALHIVKHARERIVRPLSGNVAGNVAHVLRARKFIQAGRGRKGGGLSDSEMREAEEWLEQMELDRSAAREAPSEEPDAPLYVCMDCGYPV